jgi:N-methylhydantoinase A
VDSAVLAGGLDETRSRAQAALAAPAGSAVDEGRWLDMRYLRQNHELRIPVDPGPIGDGAVASLVARFHEAHRSVHGYAAAEAPVQVVSVRVALRVPPPPLPAISPPAALRAPTPRASREVFFEEAGRRLSCPAYGRADLPAGFVLGGPAVVEQMDSTVLVPPGVELAVHASGSLVLAL